MLFSLVAPPENNVALPLPTRYNWSQDCNWMHESDLEEYFTTYCSTLQTQVLNKWKIDPPKLFVDTGPK